MTLARPARADVIAGFVQGQGGLSSTDTTTSTRTSSLSASSGLVPGLGFQVGARLLFVEGYYDRTAFGSGASVQRGIVGVRGKIGLGDFRLVLRAGAGILTEHGGAISGSAQGGDRRGAVGRVGRGAGEAPHARRAHRRHRSRRRGLQPGDALHAQRRRHHLRRRPVPVATPQVRAGDLTGGFGTLPGCPLFKCRTGDAGAADAAIAVGVLRQVLLVIVLGVVELGRGRDLAW